MVDTPEVHEYRIWARDASSNNIQMVIDYNARRIEELDSISGKVLYEIDPVQAAIQDTRMLQQMIDQKVLVKAWPVPEKSSPVKRMLDTKHSRHVYMVGPGVDVADIPHGATTLMDIDTYPQFYNPDDHERRCTIPDKMYRFCLCSQDEEPT